MDPIVHGPLLPVGTASIAAFPHCCHGDSHSMQVLSGCLSRHPSHVLPAQPLPNLVPPGIATHASGSHCWLTVTGQKGLKSFQNVLFPLAPPQTLLLAILVTVHLVSAFIGSDFLLISPFPLFARVKSYSFQSELKNLGQEGWECASLSSYFVPVSVLRALR